VVIRRNRAIRERESQQLVVAVEQVADAPHADRHATSGQFGMDLGQATVLGMSEPADRGDDVEAEFVLGQDDPRLVLGPPRCAEAWTSAITAPADLKSEPDGAVERDGDPVGLVGGPERAAARGAGPREGRQVDLASWRGSGGPSGHGSLLGQASPEDKPMARR
jgi:hypothetical protein